CATGGTTLWTRGRTAPDLVPQICGWFSEDGFELSWLSDPGVKYGVGAHRFTAQPRPLVAGLRMFRFVETEDARRGSRPWPGSGSSPDGTRGWARESAPARPGASPTRWAGARP